MNKNEGWDSWETELYKLCPRSRETEQRKSGPRSRAARPSEIVLPGGFYPMAAKVRRSIVDRFLVMVVS